MTGFRLSLLAALLAVAISHKIAPVEKNFNEIISVNLKKANEDIRFVAQIRIHLIGGHVHINGYPLIHNKVHNIQMNVQIVDILNGVRQTPKRKSVQVRILVEESNTNGIPKLYVEEEFIAVEGVDVEQVNVHQVIWESNIRKPLTIVQLVKSKIHAQPREQDHSMFIKDDVMSPHLPKHGYGYDEEYEQESHHDHHNHHDHHDHHHNCHKHHGHDHHHNGTMFSGKMHGAKCWYKSLSWKSKVLLFSIGFFGLLTAVVCCGLCSKRRRARKAILQVSAPMDDSVTVDVEKAKKGTKKNVGELDFHFEFDNTVTVDDKKPLIEDA